LECICECSYRIIYIRLGFKFTLVSEEAAYFHFVCVPVCTRIMKSGWTFCGGYGRTDGGYDRGVVR